MKLQKWSHLTANGIMSLLFTSAIAHTNNIPNASTIAAVDRVTSIISETEPFKMAVAECAADNRTLTGCDSGKQGIPEKVDSSKSVASITVTNGVITVVPLTQNGFLGSDTLILTPTLTSDSSVAWVMSGELLKKVPHK